ncbi:MAG: phosphopantetheine adenylyltransferase [Nitrososphaerales archaeon]
MKDRVLSYRYRSAGVGGTFDHIHKGHEALLGRAFETAERVFIGLTTDEFAALSGKKIDRNFEFREKELERYLKEVFPKREYVITRLEKNFGPGMFTSDIEAVVVSTETKGRVPEANEKRRELGLPDLRVEVVPMVLADDGERISSTRIRAGEIDPAGRKLK